MSLHIAVPNYIIDNFYWGKLNSLRPASKSLSSEEPSVRFPAMEKRFYAEIEKRDLTQTVKADKRNIR